MKDTLGQIHEAQSNPNCPIELQVSRKKHEANIVQKHETKNLIKTGWKWCLGVAKSD